MEKSYVFLPILGVQLIAHYDRFYTGFEISADTHILPYFTVCSFLWIFSVIKVN